MQKELIRNFSIIAHIDHGKSTLADRMLEYTHSVTKREFKEQMLDSMDLERERGITIKASSVSLNYKAKNGNTYLLNLIDTPGHVDFTFEVAKSIPACEGAILVVDAAQGVQAQTVANLYLAMEHRLKIIPVVNKIDLPNAEPARVKQQIKDLLKFKEEHIISASAKEGTGTEKILEAIVSKIPPPSGNSDSPLKALIFDSNFNTYKGVIIHIRIFDGIIKKGMKIKFMSTQKEYEVQEIGKFTPKPKETDQLVCGEVGYLSCNLRDPNLVTNGDTVTTADNPAAKPLPGYHKITPMVFCGIYPVNSKDFPALKVALGKLKLSDASFFYEPESSTSLGHGYRCGFLGLLHMEIVQERLEREYDLNLVLTNPSVVYKVYTKKGECMELDNAAKLPNPTNIAKFEEPYVKAFIIIPFQNLSNVMELAKSRRGIYKETEYLDAQKIKVIFELPLCEIIVDFYDKIKSMTKGYGSLDYEFLEYKETELVKLDILINGKICDPLSSVAHREKAQDKGKKLVEKLKELIPRQLFEVVVQAAVGSRIIASERVRPLGKNVTGKCYGGDITRKRKLWAKQKAGKKRLKQFGNVQIPQEAFLAAIKI